MSDARADLSPAPAGPGSPGVWLREAREQAGLSIDAVAATLKLSPRTLMALEADDHASLRDAVFVRALAQSVCRVLQRDPAPVLAMLPRAVMRAPQPLADQDEIRSEDGRFQRRAAWPALVLTPLTAVLAGKRRMLAPARGAGEPRSRS
ncbi:MAG: helix-turn-helix domain-containing protein [Betaproteobacteria bacterium]|nr:helix-turn-helix domain-containing protein [Betaproteobacteria bacterium]